MLGVAAFRDEAENDLRHWPPSRLFLAAFDDARLARPIFDTWENVDSEKAERAALGIMVAIVDGVDEMKTVEGCTRRKSRCFVTSRLIMTKFSDFSTPHRKPIPSQLLLINHRTEVGMFLFLQYFKYWCNSAP